MQKCTMAKNEQMFKDRTWYEIDATDVILGDLAVYVANLLRGKNKPIFTPNLDCGDYVIVRNAKKIKLTGNKLVDKKYYDNSLYIGGMRCRNAQEMVDKFSEELIYEAVKGMIPKNRLGRSVIGKLFVYKDEGKKHESQKPVKVQVA
ncbi:MAG: 50S ribosomal protein L13 [Mycoplasmataceae bacterium]|nr:50S ribosomal protein L13 [Mycoplasmataceae bacterium]